MRPRILLVDDHEIVRKGIRELLEGPTRNVCGEAASGEEALQKVTELKPDLVVMDYLLPGTKVVILTMDDAGVKEAKKAGADGCVHKASVVAELHQTVTRILIGRRLTDGW